MRFHVYLYLFLSLLYIPSRGGESHVAKSDTAAHAMVVAAHPLAVKVGNAILQKGGNAVDAAVAMAFAVGVVEPHASGLGGGGGMLIYLSEEDAFRYIDYYMRTAQNADTAYADSTNLFTARSVCVPGTPAGLLMAAERYGRLPIRDLLAPAIRIARQGFVVSDKFYTSILDKLDLLMLFPETQAMFFKDDFPVSSGDTLSLIALAGVLENLAEYGADYFYHGEFARQAAAAVQQAGGYITFEDFAAYRPLEREPVTINYRGYDIYSAPPPQSGTTLLEILNIYEQFAPPYPISFRVNATAIHVLCAAIKRADTDRYHYLGDPEYVSIPIDGLLHKQYADQRYADIDLAGIKYADNYDIPYGNPWIFNSTLTEPVETEIKEEGPHTTHISVVDADGNAVSLTQTLGLFFGSGFSSQGVIFNSAMSVFYRKPSPNHIGPRRRPLTTISPTLIFKDDTMQAVVGTPGGGRIFNVLAQVIIRLLDFKLTAQQAVESPRFSVRISSKKLRMEPGFSQGIIGKLGNMGYRTDISSGLSDYFGGVQLILYDAGLDSYIGVSDSRRDGGAQGY